MSRKPGRPPPPDVARLIEDGRAHERQGRLREAEFCYQSALRMAPKSPEALNALGMLVQKAGRHDLAAEHFGRAARLAPREPAYLNNLGNAYLQLRRPQEALAPLKKALAAAPKIAGVRMNLGRAFRHLGRTDEAVAAFERVRAAAPDFPGVERELGQAWLDAGAADRARPHLRAALAADPADAEALYALAGLAAAGERAALLARIDAALARETRASHRATLQFAAGTMLDAAGEYDAAFGRFRAANECLRGPAGVEALRDFVDGCERHLTRDVFAERAARGHASRRPVFIVGMPRSGTTLVEQILASHPAVAGGGELTAIETVGAALAAGSAGPWNRPDRLAGLTGSQLAAGAERYLKELRAVSRDAAHVTDKMPHNFLALGLVALMFPGARIIDCRRGAMDTCLSCYVTRFNRRHAYAADLAALGAYYRQYHRLMAHWTAALPGRIHRIGYEELIADPEPRIRGLLAFLGLDWAPSCLDFHRAPRAVTTPSRLQVRRPLYATSVGRWQNYAAHLGPLRDALGDLAEA